MGRPRMEAPELEQYRPIFENYNLKRMSLQRELAQMLKARNEEMYKEVVGRVMWAKAAGYTPAEIQNSMGVSRTTQVSYQAKWREWYGETSYEELYGPTGGRGEAAKSSIIPDDASWTARNGRIRISRAGRFMGELEDGRWYDDAVGVTVPEVPDWVREVGLLVEGGESERS